jgi:hypothetical protein
MNQHGHIKCCKWVPWQHLDGSWFALYFHRQRNIKFSFRRHILYNKINFIVVGTTTTNKISKVFVPKARKQYSRNGSHGNTKINKNCKKLKLIKKNCNARHAPESNLHQVEDFLYWKKRRRTHCRKLIVTGIYQANSYQTFVISYCLAFVPKALNILSILKCNNYVLTIGLFRAFPSNKIFITSNLDIRVITNYRTPKNLTKGKSKLISI